MNSDEGVSLAKMAVTVLLVVLVIGAVVAIVYAAYSWFSSGTDKLGDQVTSIDKSAFSQYDDTKVSGTDVLSALKTYRESEIAIFISNLKNQDGTYTATPRTGTIKSYNYCALASDGNNAQVAGEECSLVRYDEATGSLAGCFTIENGLYYDEATQNLARNTNFSPTTTNSRANEFVKQSANWYANLVYDETTGDVCGILFRQMN